MSQEKQGPVGVWLEYSIDAQVERCGDQSSKKKQGCCFEGHADGSHAREMWTRHLKWMATSTVVSK